MLGTDPDAIGAALRLGYATLADLVWGHLPSHDEAIGTIEANRHLV